MKQLDIQALVKTLTAAAGISGLALNLAACGGGGSAPAATQPPAPQTVTVSGKVENLNDTGEPAVTVEAVYVNPGDAGNPTTTTNGNGDYSLAVKKDSVFYLRLSKAGFATINTQKGQLSTDQANTNLPAVTRDEAQTIINTAMPMMPLLANHAWFSADVEDANNNELNGKTFDPINPMPVAQVYTNCDGTDSGLDMTTGAPCADRSPAPMYLAYLDMTADVSVTVDGDTETGSVRMGEITIFDF